MKRILIILIFLSAAFAVQAQKYKMVYAEYFIDNDPGFKHGTPITLTNDSLVDLNLNVDISTLPGGQHFLFIRALNDSGYWSVSFIQNFIASSVSSSPLINYVEYFIDNDPGFGHATVMPVTPDSLIDATLAFNISGLSGGMHMLGVRARKTGSGWSQTVLKPFVVSSGTQSPTVLKVEYAFDNDPGFGHATSIALTPDSLIDTNLNFNVSSLSNGSHLMMMRTQDANGGWSQTFTKLVMTNPSASLPPITKLRYGFDTAPLMGQGLTAAISHDTLVDQTVNLNLTGLTPAYHKVYYYAQDSAKAMSLMNMDSVYSGPKAAFKTDTVCLGDSTLITDLTTGGDINTIYSWDVNNDGTIDFTTSGNHHYLFPTAGTHSIKLVVHNNPSFPDTLIKQVMLRALPAVTVNPISPHICPTQSATLTVSGATTYTWSTSATTATITVTPTVTAIYTVTGTDVFGCNSQVQDTVTVNPLDSLSGIINDTLLNPVTAGRVYLFRQKTTNVGLLDTAGNILLAANGKFTFPSLVIGNYFLKAVADTNVALYKTSVATYYSNKQNPYRWDSAIVIHHNTCTGANDLGYNIKIIQMPGVASGPGTITGVVSEGPGYGQRIIHTGYAPMGAPLKGVDIKLGKNPGGSPAARTTSDNTGHYSFHGVPLGNYKIYVDIPNYGMDSIRDVILTSTSNNSVHNDYYVDSNSVRVVPTYSTTAAICPGDSIKLQGSYQHTAGLYFDTLSASAGYDSLIATVLSVKPIPTLTVSAGNDTICNGNQAIITALGNSTSYLWSANAGSATTSTVSVSPTTNTNYTVTGSLAGCANKQTINIIVNPVPTLTVSAGSDTVCIGNSITLTAAGNSTSYLWSANAGSVTTSTVSVSPTANTTYTVTGTLNNCPNNQTISIIASSCIGIAQYTSPDTKIAVYPNPLTGSITVQSSGRLGEVTIYNSLGEVVYQSTTQLLNNLTIDLSKQTAGIYILHTGGRYIRLVKE